MVKSLQLSTEYPKGILVKATWGLIIFKIGIEDKKRYNHTGK